MGNILKRPGEDESAPVESRRAILPDPDAARPDSGPAGVESTIDMPDMGEFSPESARPTPLDDIAEAERERAPRD